MADQPIYGPRIREDEAYAVALELLVLHLLKDVSAAVAHVPGKPDQVLGFALYQLTESTPVLHWVYVKFAYRRAGVARSLLDQIIPNFGRRDTHITLRSSAIHHLKRKWRLTWVPSRLYGAIDLSLEQ